MFEREKEKYAEILIKVGLELKNGQPVFVEAPTEAAEFVPILVKKGYELGASIIHVNWNNYKIDDIQCEQDNCGWGVGEKELYQFYADQGAGYIRLICPHFSERLNPDKQSTKKEAQYNMEKRMMFRRADKQGGFTLACIPCDEWADKVCSDIEKPLRLQKLWQIVLKCMKCNQPDPIDEWKKYMQASILRRKLLEKNHYVCYRFSSDRTNLTIEPTEINKWFGGCIEYSDRTFIPNLPTEEVFSVPNRLKTNGYVHSTLPLLYDGKLIEDFTLVFKNGKVVEFDAKKGLETLESILNIDEGSSYLGEFALVDQMSSIAQENRVFYNTLFDENASCHLALGMIAGQMPMDRAEELGLNQSSVHVDFMFGSNNLLVEGMKNDGSWEEIMSNGRWTKAFQLQ